MSVVGRTRGSGASWGHGNMDGVVLASCVSWHRHLGSIPSHVWVVERTCQGETLALDFPRPRWRCPWTPFPS
jgi:hypothetical protein